MGKESRIMEYYISKQEEVDFVLNQSAIDAEDFQVEKAFSKSIRTKKDTTTYNAHSYPTKVPPEGITPFIKHYTKPGDVVLDPFCGSGMTGLGVRMFTSDSGEQRNVILNDLGTAATHIAYNYNNPVDANELESEFNKILQKLSKFRTDMYKTYHSLDKNFPLNTIKLDKLSKAKSNNGILSIKQNGKVYQFVEAEIVTAIWSEVNECTNCEGEINLWEVAMNPKTGKMAKSFKCTHCNTTHSRKDFKSPKSSEATYLIYEYTCPKTNRLKRSERNMTSFDREILSKLERKRITTWYPTQDISPKREMMTMGPAKLGITKVSDFYTKRNLNVCSQIWNEIDKLKCERTKAALKFACTNTFWHATRMRRFNVKGGMRPLTGTLYVPQISAECNVFKVLTKKVNELVKFYSLNIFKKDLLSGNIQTCHLNESATDLKPIPDSSIDYIFTDPPFGGNIFYSDCNVIWEGWLNKLTDDTKEILFNRSRKPKDGGKTRSDYHMLMDSAFSEMFRVLKSGKWASVVFNNSDNDILAGFLDSAVKAGFQVEEVTFFDKDQKSVKGYMGQKGIQNVTNLDIVLTVRKPLEDSKVKSISRKKVDDRFIYNQIQKYLADLPKKIRQDSTLFTEEHRTTPFLHSMLLRKFIKKNIDLRELTIERINFICENGGMNYKNGHWYIKQSNTEVAA